MDVLDALKHVLVHVLGVRPRAITVALADYQEVQFRRVRDPVALLDVVEVHPVHR